MNRGQWRVKSSEAGIRGRIMVGRIGGSLKVSARGERASSEGK